MIENIAKISGGRCADLTIERTSYGIKIRQKSSFLALTSAMFDELVAVVDDLEDCNDGPELGELYAHESRVLHTQKVAKQSQPAVTPAKYAAGARP